MVTDWTFPSRRLRRRRQPAASPYFNHARYDANGNLTATPELTLAYDVENRLVEAVAQGWTVRYAYAPNGQMVRTYGGFYTGYFFYGIDGRLLGTYNLASSAFRVDSTNVYFGSRLLKQRSSGEMFYVPEDRLGTVNTYSVNYTPYGDMGIDRGAKLGFTGYYGEGTTGLDYAQQRYYAPALGRFTTPDPYQASAAIARPQSWNRYAYVENGPVNFVDPSGLYRHCPGGTHTDSTGMGCEADSAQKQIQDEQQPLLRVFTHSSGGGSPVSEEWRERLRDSRNRLTDRIDDDCAEAIGAKDSAAAFKKLDGVKVGFHDLKAPAFLSTPAGIQATKEEVPNAVWDRRWLTSGGIFLNLNVNWSDPNKTPGLLDGKEFMYRALDAYAYKLGIESITAEQFMDLMILHELAHAFNDRKDPDMLANEKDIWEKCFR